MREREVPRPSFDKWGVMMETDFFFLFFFGGEPSFQPEGGFWGGCGGVRGRGGRGTRQLTAALVGGVGSNRRASRSSSGELLISTSR